MKTRIPQRQIDVDEVEAALNLMKQGRFKDVVWPTLRDAIDRLAARSNAFPNAEGVCGHEIPLSWHCPKCAREAKECGDVG